MDRLKQRLTRAGIGWAEDNIPRLAAAFSFFTVLSVAPLLVLAVVVGGYFLGEATTLEKLISEARGYVGSEGAELLRSLVEATKRPTASTIATIASLVITFFGASNLFMNLVDSVNFIWGIRPKGSVVKSLILLRIAAFLGVLAFSVVFLGWLAFDAWLNWLERQTKGFAGWHWFSLSATIIFLTLTFATTYYHLPKDRIAFRDTIIPGFITAVGITIFKYLLGLYFQYAGASTAYGPAGALVVILLWIFYAAQVFFFGIEMCYVTAIEGQEDQQPPKVIPKPTVEPRR
jgi:membrane protein